MKILIPSYKRAGYVKTRLTLDCGVIVCHEFEYDEYMEKGFQDLPNNVMDKLDQLSDDEREEVMDRVRDILDDKFGDGEGDDEGDDGESNYRQDMLKFFQQAKESIKVINGKKYKKVKEHAWDRKFGEPLPTLTDVMKKKVTEKHPLRETYERIGGK